MVFKEDKGGVNDEKLIINAKRWDLYMSKRQYLFKDGYSVRVSGSDGVKVLWKLVDKHVV